MGKQESTLYEDVMSQFKDRDNVNVTVNVNVQNSDIDRVPDMYMDDVDEDGKVEKPKRNKKEKSDKSKKNKSKSSDSLSIQQIITGIITLVIAFIFLTAVIKFCANAFSDVNIIQDNLQIEEMFK